VKKVLFVCTANICRSPMAAAMFNALAEDGTLPFRAESAGTAALEGRPMAENSLAALEEVGIHPEAHRARRVSEAMIGEAGMHYRGFGRGY
jgi:protein-tyrosine-phosphatase